MTIDEARKVAAIAETADGGCCVCVRSLAEELQETFPEFTWTFEEEEEQYRVHIFVEVKPDAV